MATAFAALVAATAADSVVLRLFALLGIFFVGLAGLALIVYDLVNWRPLNLVSVLISLGVIPILPYALPYLDVEFAMQKLRRQLPLFEQAVNARITSDLQGEPLRMVVFF